MYKITLWLALLISNHGFTQQKWSSLQLGVQRSFHGTGDLSGVAVDAGYDHSFDRKWDLYGGITSTIHSRKFVFSSLPPDKTLNFTTAGIQLTSLIQWALIARTDHRLKIGAGPLFRFQSTSLPTAFGTTYDPSVYPEPFYTVSQAGSYNTFTLGYSAAIIYQPRLSYRYHLGFKIQFQNDTNGDVISGFGILVGRFTSR